VANDLILIVDDNELDRKLARDVLRYHGFDTLDACCATDGIKLAVEQQPDLILMDVRLPDADGVEVVATLRADPRCAKIPVFALTALAMPDDERMLLAAGFRGYLCKPIAVLELPDLIRRQLASRAERIPCSPDRASS
jgi:two-component system cell cycle response regulator DivK